MKRIFCFGDSNTYGFDPAPDWGDDRYPASVRWTARLNAHPGWEILNYGENGRQIPHTPTALGLLYRELLAAAPLAAFVVMLGSNDLFWMAWPTPEALAQRMDGLLELVQTHPTIRECQTRLLLIAPPPVDFCETEQQAHLSRCSLELAAAYSALAARRGIAFADAGSWQIPTAFDGVHFSEKGHARFAQHMESALHPLLS